MKVGWCPGALRPMASGDGFVVRLRVRGGVLEAGLAGRIAAWSQRWGNGTIELTNRGNLQMRGVAARDLPALQAAMGEAGLLDDSAAAEAVRNVIVSPLAGLDPAAAMDVRPVAAALERRLADDPVLHGLPGKFGFAVDDGGRFGLDDVPAAIRFIAADGGFAVVLDGAPGVALGPVRPGSVEEVAAVLARRFLDRAGGALQRMRDLVADEGVAAIGRGAGLELARAPAARGPAGLLGVQTLGTAAFLGVGLTFGRVAAADFAALARVGEMRLTAWRAVLLPVGSVAAAARIAGGLPAALIIDPADPRRRVAACVGAPGCTRASTPVLADAERLAGALAGVPGEGVVLHVSGCEKGCAHPGQVAVRLVGRSGGYEVEVDGKRAVPAALIAALRPPTRALPTRGSETNVAR